MSVYFYFYLLDNKIETITYFYLNLYSYMRFFDNKLYLA